MLHSHGLCRINKGDWNTVCNSPQVPIALLLLQITCLAKHKHFLATAQVALVLVALHFQEVIPQGILGNQLIGTHTGQLQWLDLLLTTLRSYWTLSFYPCSVPWQKVQETPNHTRQPVFLVDLPILVQGQGEQLQGKLKLLVKMVSFYTLLLYNVKELLPYIYLAVKGLWCLPVSKYPNLGRTKVLYAFVCHMLELPLTFSNIRQGILQSRFQLLNIFAWFSLSAFVYSCFKPNGATHRANVTRGKD